MELIEGSETSAISIVTPGKYPKENILHTGHGESLKSRNLIVILFCFVCLLLTVTWTFVTIVCLMTAADDAG